MSINKRIKNIYIDRELALPIYNTHPYLSLKNLGKIFVLYTAKCGRGLVSRLYGEDPEFCLRHGEFEIPLR